MIFKRKLKFSFNDSGIPEPRTISFVCNAEASFKTPSSSAKTAVLIRLYSNLHRQNRTDYHLLAQRLSNFLASKPLLFITVPGVTNWTTSRLTMPLVVFGSSTCSQSLLYSLAQSTYQYSLARHDKNATHRNRIIRIAVTTG